MAGEEALPSRSARRRKAVRASCCTTARPYANGDIHIGHAEQDPRGHHRPRENAGGLRCPYVPGWDCHGLPIEHQIEKLHGKGIPGDKVRELCRAFATEQVERQKKDFIRLGVLGDGTTRT